MDGFAVTPRPRRILITGAGGFTGGHACRRFAESGWEVVAVQSPRGGAIGGSAKLADPEGAAHVHACDLTDGDAVLRLFRLYRPEALLHLAGRNSVDSSWREPAVSLSANLMSTVHLLEAARKAEGEACPALIVGSMLRTSPDRLSRASHPYGFSKTLQVVATEAWHHWYGLPVIVVEPSNLIGPGSSGGLCGKLANWVVAAEECAGLIAPFRLSSLTETRDFLDVRDAVVAYERLLEAGSPGVSYALESGILRKLGEVKQAFDTAAHVSLRWQVDNEPSSSPKGRDSTLIRGIGWKPVISFEQSIYDVLEDERARRNKERGGG
jgi:nucleoside-diphosphate-sugar epimerase